MSADSASCFPLSEAYTTENTARRPFRKAGESRSSACGAVGHGCTHANDAALAVPTQRTRFATKTTAPAAGRTVRSQPIRSLKSKKMRSKKSAVPIHVNGFSLIKSLP